MRLIILGDPITKKNHGRVVKRGNKKFHIPSEAQEKWSINAASQLRQQRLKYVAAGRIESIAWPVNLACIVYRGNKPGRRGDLIGYLQAVCDVLEEPKTEKQARFKAGILADDKWIVQFDGCRFGELPEGAQPHIAIELTTLDL